MKDYKKILEGVVDIINATEKSDIGFVNICTYIGENCPELKESEDEKIRSSLLKYLKDMRESTSTPFSLDNAKLWIAWLEKQGEQKPWSEEDEIINNNISHIIRQYDKIRKIENQPCWYIGDCLLWMQNIKDRVQPQPKQEWREEDEKMLESIIASCTGFDATTGTIMVRFNEHEKKINWLKSLKDRYIWRPSDEQFKLLKHIMENVPLSYIDKSEVGELYLDLKKLRRE